MIGIKKRIHSLSGAVLAAALVLSSSPFVYATSQGYNGKILFLSNRDGNNDLYTMNMDGSGVTNITNDPGADIDPVWSGDGTRVAFISNRSGANELYVMNADGTNLVRLTSGGSARTPTWYPDSSKIIYASFRDGGNAEFYTISPNGSDDTRLTFNAVTDFEPDVSPDGTKITFRGPGLSSDIWVMNIDGTNPVQLTSNLGNDFAPKWSVDGSHILFHNASLTTNNDVYRINPDGSGQAAIVTGAPGDHHASYSPDGAYIIMASSRSGVDEVYLINPDGTNNVNLSNNAAIDNSPSIQPLNLDPILSNDSASTTPNRPVTGDVLANDTDAYESLDTSSMSIESVSGGTATINGDGTITFTPANEFTGTGTVVYKICSLAHTALCSTAIFSVMVASSPAQLAATGQSALVVGIGSVLLILGSLGIRRVQQ